MYHRCLRPALVSFLVLLGGALARDADAHGFSWVAQAGGPADDGAWAVAVDSHGNSYVTGSFPGVATFGPGEPHETTLTAFGPQDIFVAKYTRTGALAWVTQAGSLDQPVFGSASSYGIAVDNHGEVVVTGQFSRSATFGRNEPGESLLIGLGNFDIFVARYNRFGLLQWATRAGGATGGSDAGLSVVLDTAGDAYVTGQFSSIGSFAPATFDSTDDNSQTLFSESTDVFLAKYSRRGVLRWVQRAGGNQFDQGAGIDADQHGNVYVTGSFEGAATFGVGSFEQTVSAGASRDVFLAKYTPTGVLRWVKHSVGSG